MKVVINALHVHPGATGGGETYLLELVRALGGLACQDEIVVLIWPKAEPSLRPLCNERVSYRIVQRTPFHRLLRGLLRKFAPPHPTGWLANVRADLLHWPNSVIMLNPFSLAVPSVLTAHDIQHEFFPEFFTPDDLALRRQLFPASLARAQTVIAISNFTRDSLVERYGISPHKIRVIYSGVNHARFSEPTDEAKQQAVRRRYALPERFLLYPAGTWPHKNHLRLLQAVCRTKGAHLILTGIRQRAHETILSEITRLKLDDRVKHIGHVDSDELPALYQCAEGVIFPSQFEGFGLPVLEGMAAHRPVAMSNHPALLEIGGSAAFVFDPEDVDAIADAIEKLWSDDALKHKLVALGDAHCTQFCWEQTALKTLEVYQETLTHRPSS